MSSFVSTLRSRITQVSGSCIVDVGVYVEVLWFRVSSSHERVEIGV